MPDRGRGIAFGVEDGIEEVFGGGFTWSNQGNIAACFDGVDEARANHAIEEATNAGGFSIQGDSDFGGGKGMSSFMEGVEDIDTRGCEGVAEEGIVGKGPAGVVGVEGEGEGTRFEVVAGEVDGGGMVGVVRVQKHNAVGNGGECGSASQSTEGIFRIGLADLVGEEDGEVIGVGDAFEGGEDGCVIRFVGRGVKVGEGVDDDETGCRVLLEPGFEGVEAAAGEEGPGVLPIEGMRRRADLQLLVGVFDHATGNVVEAEVKNGRAGGGKFVKGGLTGSDGEGELAGKMGFAGSEFACEKGEASRKEALDDPVRGREGGLAEVVEGDGLWEVGG